MTSLHPCRHLIRFIVLLLTLILSASLRAQVNLTVNAAQTGRTVDERVFGVNAVIWDGKTGSDQTVAMVQAAGIRAIRVPGGSLSDEYHWRINKSLDNTWLWSASFGDYPAVNSPNLPTGKGFINLITSTNTQPVVTVNYGSGTPEEAAGLVAYLNASVGSNVTIGGTDGLGVAMQNSGYWASLRAANPLGSDDGMNFLRIGRSSPVGAKYFEIGNECYGTWEKDLQGENNRPGVAHDPTTYANRVQQYITKMKAVDPTIKIGVVVVTSSENSGYKNWTPVMLAQLKTLGAIPDFIIYHLYPQAPNAESDATLLQVADSGSRSWTSIATDLRTQLNTYLTSQTAAGVEIVVTENNSVYTSPGKQSTSLVNGLYLADSVANLMKTEINGYMYWALRNGTPTVNNAGLVLDGNMSSSLYGWRQFGDYGMLSTPSTLTGETTSYNPYPTYYMMKLLSKFARGGDTVVQATSSNSILSVFAAKRVDGTLAVLVINKDAANAQTGNIALTGFTPSANVTVYSYGKSQDLATADVATSSMSIAGSTFSTSFSSYSATVILFNQGVAPSFTTQPASQSVSVGSAVTFTAAASGTPAPSYQWQKGGVNIAGATNASFTIASVTTGDAGSYTVIATNATGGATSNSATLYVGVVPAFTTQPVSQTVNAGVAATFTVAASGTPAPGYQWQKNNVNIGGATGSTYTIASAALGDAGNYTCVATNSIGRGDEQCGDI